jgi:phosphoribosylamine--glycine ligase
MRKAEGTVTKASQASAPKSFEDFGCSLRAVRAMFTTHAALKGRTMQDLCKKYGIPTASYAPFKSVAPAHKHINKHKGPLVVKAVGLAAGKGVIVCTSPEEARDAVTGILEGGMFGDAGKEVVIEEFLEGEEASFFALLDGNKVLALTSAQDHKAAFDGDQGPNTGGMGAYSPAPVVSAAIEKQVLVHLFSLCHIIR